MRLVLYLAKITVWFIAKILRLKTSVRGKNYVKQLTGHVLETRVTPPIFNLQWLYDLTFNEKKVLHLDDE